MNLFLDSFWRALAYCFRPRLVLLSLLPFVLIAFLSLTFVLLFWDQALNGLRDWLAEWVLLESLLRWMESVGFANLRAVMVPLLVLLLALPVFVVISLLAVAWLMTPAIVNLVAQRRFPQLARRQGGSPLRGMFLGITASMSAVLMLLLSMPLWLIPPLVLILPPLIWGWLTYRVMTYDVLADYASEIERKALIRRHKFWLFGIGVVTGYLGAAPSLIWASGALAIVFAPLLIPLAIWIYTFVFAFSALWFTHYGLAALAVLRTEPLDALVLGDERNVPSL